jgi:hypothetical protein
MGMDMNMGTWTWTWTWDMAMGSWGGVLWGGFYEEGPMRRVIWGARVVHDDGLDAPHEDVRRVLVHRPLAVTHLVRGRARVGVGGQGSGQG